MKKTANVTYIREDFKQNWFGDVFDCARHQEGKVYRDKEGRRTLSFEANGSHYFLKLHQGIGWKEIIKNLLQARLPVLGAQNEWEAIQKLEVNNIATMSIAAYGKTGCNPAHQTSFLVTDALTGTMSLEHLGQQWRERPPSVSSKRTLIKKLAEITKQMHGLGMNHRDYYLCHFLLDDGFAEHNQITDDTTLHLIDLHRAQQRRAIPERWRIKDLAGLYFSAMDVPMTQRDIFRFMTEYTGLPLRELLSQQKQRWQKVEARAVKLYRKEHG